VIYPREPRGYVAMALEEHAEITAAFAERNDEIACHGFRWIDYQRVDEAIEREHMRVGVDIIKRMTGTAPLGWYTVRDSADTRRLQHEFQSYLQDERHDRVRVCRRVDIARHWMARHPRPA